MTSNFNEEERQILFLIKKLEENPVFDFLRKIQKEFPESEIYLVGGAVRDFFLQREGKDYDFVIRGVAKEKLRLFLAKIGIVNLVGRLFGVFKFIPYSHYQKFKEEKFEPFDIALPRTEHSYFSGAYRDCDVLTDPNLPIEKDLARRDFTINALALRITPFKDSKENLVVDPFEGKNDLKNKIVRAVGNPEERFQEDYSRMLRALRFACELNFEIEENTFLAIKNNIQALNKKTSSFLSIASQQQTTGVEWIVPRETIAKEMIKAFYAHPVKAFDLFDQSGAFEILIPEIIKMKGCPQPPEFHSEGDVFTHTRLALKKLQSEEYKKLFGEEKPSAELIFALLLHDIGKPSTLKTPELHGVDRIRFDEHNEVGAEISRKIIHRLKLESLPQGTPLHLKAENIVWLIRNHLLLLQSNPKEMRASTIEKYFFNPLVPGEELIRLSFCDAQATFPANGLPNMENFEAMMKRIEEVGKLAKERKKLPKPLLDGYEIMAILNLQSGPKVGKIIQALREEQLEGRINSKEEAIEFIKRLNPGL
jgi:poly(A) polymerase